MLSQKITLNKYYFKTIFLVVFFLFLYCFFLPKISYGAEVVAQYNYGWTTTSGGGNQDFTMYLDLATSSVAFVSYVQDNPSSNCNYTKGRFASANIDGVYFEDISRYEVNSADVYFGYASSTIPAGTDKQFVIDTNLLPGGGASCNNHFNLFFISGVVASSVLSTIIDGGNFSSPTNYNFTATTPEKNSASGLGVFQLAVQGFTLDRSTYTATSSFTVITDDDDFLFSSFYQKQPGIYSATNFKATFTSSPAQAFIFLAQFPLGESIPPTDELIITAVDPLCQSQDQVFTLNFPAGMNGYRYYYGFNVPVCSVMASFDGYRDLSIYNIGQAFATSSTAYGSSSLALCSYLVDSVGNPVQVWTSYYDVYASTSAECVGSYFPFNYDYWCADVCDGLATSTLGGDVACGLRRFGCWSFYPHSTSRSYFSNSWQSLKSSFPFSLYFDLTEAIAGFSTSTTATQGLSFPIPTVSDGGATITMQTIITASTTQNTIGKNNYYNIRQAVVWFLWILAALYIITRLTRHNI
jgi:hypothetical protein